MKRIFYITSLLALTGTLLFSCGRENINYQEDSNDNENLQMVNLNIGSILKLELETGSANTRTETDFSEYTVTLYQEDNTLTEQWLYKDMPELVSVLQGNYYITVTSHEQQSVDTKPYYEGKSNVFSVQPGAITEVEPIVCKMRSIKIVLTFDSELSALLGTDIKITVATDKASYEYTDLQNITPMYFAPSTEENNMINITFDGTVDGYKESYTRTETANAGDYLEVRFTLKNVSDENIEASGSAGLSLKLDLKVTNITQNTNITTGEEVIPEEPEEGGDEEGDETLPTIKGRGFDIKTPQTVPADGMTCIVDITAAMRFAHLYVTIDSETLTSSVLEDVGLTNSFDLAYPGKLESALGKDENGNGLGFPVGNQVIGQKTLVFDITPFTQLLGIYGAATHKFIIKVVDQEGTEVEETLTLISE